MSRSVLSLWRGADVRRRDIITRDGTVVLRQRALKRVHEAEFRSFAEASAAVARGEVIWLRPKTKAWRRYQLAHGRLDQ